MAEARPDASGPTPSVLSVPRADAPWKPTGEFNVGIWGKSPRTRTLLDDRGQGAVPVSEARFLWQGPNLYFFFYAGDLDLQCHTKRRDGPVWLDDSVAMTFIATDGARRMIRHFSGRRGRRWPMSCRREWPGRRALRSLLG